MDNYTPPFTITNTILSLVASISEKIGRIALLSNLEAKPHLRKNNRIKSIHSSLKIEANSLSLNQVRDVINGKLVLSEQKEIQEVKNAYAAYGKISEINPYSISDLKKFHGIMTKYIEEESGEFRHDEEGVFHGRECIFMAPPAQFVPQLMEQLFNWMKRNQVEVHPLILSCIFHYEFVFIHPFSDGNGRMAKIMAYCSSFQMETGLWICSHWKPDWKVSGWLLWCHCKVPCVRRIYFFYRIHADTDWQSSGRTFYPNESGKRTPFWICQKTAW